MNIGTVPVIGRIVDSLDSFLVLVRLHKHDYRIPGDLIHDGCVIQTSHEFELMVDQCCVAHLPLNRQVHQDVERIHRDYVEPLDRAWLVDDRLNVVHGNLDGFEECKRRSEAIRQLQVRCCEVNTDVTREALILKAVDEAEYLCSGISSVNGQTSEDGLTRGAKRLFSIMLIRYPAETIRIHIAILVDQAGETFAEVPLKPNFGGLDPFLGPSRLRNGGFGDLEKRHRGEQGASFSKFHDCLVHFMRAEILL